MYCEIDNKLKTEMEVTHKDAWSFILLLNGAGDPGELYALICGSMFLKL